MTTLKTKYKVLTALFVVLFLLTVATALPMWQNVAVAEIVQSTGDVFQTSGTEVTGFTAEYLASTAYANAELVNVVIPEGTTSIAAEAFKGNAKILSVELPASLTAIGDEAFRDCIRLVEVYNKSTTIDLSVLEVGNKSNGYIAYSALNIYSLEGGSKITTNSAGVVMCQGTRTGVTGNYLVGYVGAAENLTLPAGTYEIYSRAFIRNSVLKSLDASAATITRIDEGAFYSCPELLTVVLPDSLTTIGASAFQDCKKLVSVNLPENLQVVGDLAFAQCEKLSGELTFGQKVTEIAQSAFLGCKAVTGVKFLNETDLSIGRGAFQGCTSSAFTSLTLPENVKLGMSAFADTAIAFVYLPQKADYAALDAGNLFFNNTARIICPGYSAYQSAVAATDSIGKHSAQMTFMVKLTFNGNDSAAATTTNRLAGQSFDFVQQTDGTWGTSETALPTQLNYASSVWFADSEFKSTVTKEDVNTVLSAAVANGVDNYIYYARYIDKASVKLTAVSGLEYSNKQSYSATDLIVESVPAHLSAAFAGGASTAKDADTYTININLAEGYGSWEAPVVLSTTIAQKVVDISEIIRWTGASNSTSFDLMTDRLYVYTKNAGMADEEVRYSLSIMTGAEASGFQLTSVINVENAIARSRSGEITVSVKLGNDFDGDISVIYTGMSLDGTPVSDGVCKSSVAGVHTAKAKISANSNYLLRTGGLSAELSADATHAIVSKSWYLVEVSNPLVVDNVSNDYWSISGWTFGDSVTVPNAPTLETPGTTAGDMTFTLVKDADTSNRLTFRGFGVSEFSDHINSSMPAGEYQLTVRVPQVEDQGIVYFPYDETYVFTVGLANFKTEWINDLKDKLVDITYPAISENGEYVLQMYGKEGERAVDLKIWEDFKTASFNPERKGIWAESTFDNLYSEGFTLTYNLNRMGTNSYFTYDEIRLDKNLVKPAAPDTYTIYYQVEAANYRSLTDINSDEKREYNFVVTIFELLVRPDVSDFVYNGTPYIVADTPLYTVILDEDDEYINAGTHKVTLVSADGSHFKWRDDQGNLHSEIEFSFQIARANNETQQPLYMSDWQFGAYDESVIPTWRTLFHDGTDEFYTFTLKGENNEVYTRQQWNTVPVGTYTLVATAKGYVQGDSTTEGYNWLAFSAETTVTVSKMHNDWYVAPDVTEWKYNGYDADTHRILGAARYNGIVFSITSDAEGETALDGLSEFVLDSEGRVSKAVAEKLNALSRGTYYLVAVVAETENYTGLTLQPIRFEVKQADNSWVRPLQVETWRTGSYNPEVNIIDAVSASGQAQIRIVDAVVGTEGEGDEGVIYDSEKGIDLLATAKPGHYILIATVVTADSDNYTGISDFITFEIFEKQGLLWWQTLLVVVGALGVVALVFYILHTKGVLQMLSGKVILAMRTKITVDATIAAVRAQKRAEEARKNIAREKMEKARAEAERIKNLSADEQVALIEEKMEKSNARTERLRRRAEKMKKKAGKNAADDVVEDEVSEDEVDATTETDTDSNTDGSEE